MDLFKEILWFSERKLSATIFMPQYHVPLIGLLLLKSPQQRFICEGADILVASVIQGCDRQYDKEGSRPIGRMWHDFETIFFLNGIQRI